MVDSVESCHGGENSCPSPQGGTLHMASRMWEVIENSSRGADGSTRCGSICPMKWCKHNTQGVRDTILPCDDSMRGCRDGSSLTSCEIVHVSRSSWGQGVRRVGVDAGGPLNGGGCGPWAGAVVSLPTEPHSDVSSCRPLTKMAPNASHCDIPGWLLGEGTTHGSHPLVFANGTPTSPVFMWCLRSTSRNILTAVICSGEAERKERGKVLRQHTVDVPLLLTRLLLRSTQLCCEQL